VLQLTLKWRWRATSLKVAEDEALTAGGTVLAFDGAAASRAREVRASVASAVPGFFRGEADAASGQQDLCGWSASLRRWLAPSNRFAERHCGCRQSPR
jgi:hypothetical protein